LVDILARTSMIFLIVKYDPNFGGRSTLLDHSRRSIPSVMSGAWVHIMLLEIFTFENRKSSDMTQSSKVNVSTLNKKIPHG
jgi:hypothetical protein